MDTPRKKPGPKPGTRPSGRQKGTPNKVTADVRAAAQKYTAEAIETLASIMRQSDVDQARIAAAKELLDRGHGKATQPIEANVTTETYEERLARLMAQAEDANG